MKNRGRCRTPSVRRFLPSVSVGLMSVVIMSPATAQDSSGVAALKRANQFLRNRDPVRASSIYESLSPATEWRALWQYNSAVALHDSGELEQACQRWQSVAASEDQTLAALARYNLGQVDLKQALSATAEDPETAERLLRQAIDRFRDSLRLNPEQPDARANLELSAIKLDQLQERRESRSPQSEQNQPGESDPEEETPGRETESQSTDRNQRSADSDFDESEQEDQEEQENSGGNDSVSTPKDEDSQRESPTDREPSDERDRQLEDSDRVNESREGGQPNDNGRSAAQGKPSEPLGKPSGSAGSSSQNQRGEEQQEEPGEEKPSSIANEQTPQSVDPAGTLSARGAEEADDETEQQAVTGQVIQGEGVDQNDSVIGLSREEALKLLQSVRDRQLLRQYQRRQREASRRIPVEKDW